MKINMFSPVYLVLVLTSCQGVVQRDGQALPNGTVSTVGRGKAERAQDTGSSPSPKMREWMQKDCRAGLSEDEFIPCIRALAAELPPLDSAKRDHFGERYSPKEWLACMERGYARSGEYGTGGCENYRLRRAANPEYWPSTTPPIQWPEAPKEVVYRSGMSSKEYFEALCQAEAGEFIYKTVEHVEGLYQIRPFRSPSDQELSDKYVLEDPYTYTRDNHLSPWDTYVQPNIGKYDFFEMPVATVRDASSVSKTNPRIDFRKLDSRYVRFFRDPLAHPGKTYQTAKDGKFVRVPYVVSSEGADSLKSQYGYTWRGINRPNARESGIAGGEQAIVDLTTGEILALRRSFMFSDLRGWTSYPSVWWLGARHCSKEVTAPTDAFIRRVLKPVNTN